VKDTIVFSFLASNDNRIQLRKGKHDKRREKWRANLSLFQKNSSFEIQSLHLLYDKSDANQLKEVVSQIRNTAPKIKIQSTPIDYKKSPDLSQVYFALTHFLDTYKFKTDSKRYYFHLNGGTSLQQLAAFKLTENHIFPGNLILSDYADRNYGEEKPFQIVDPEATSQSINNDIINRLIEDAGGLLKSGIETKNETFNQLTKVLGSVVLETAEPLLISGPDGVGKSELIRKLFELKRQRGVIKGKLIQVTCAGLIGEKGLVSLFGQDCNNASDNETAHHGLLAQASRGILFLDEIHELSVAAQTLLVTAIEENRYLPLGSDTDAEANFQLIASSQKDLGSLVRKGLFREDLYSRLNLWSFKVPALRERLEDLEVNIEHQLKLFEKKQSKRVRFQPTAWELYINFAKSDSAGWPGNFRDLNASVTRMICFAKSGFIEVEVVEKEISRLRQQWQACQQEHSTASAVNLSDYLSEKAIQNIDDFDKPQLKHVIWTCQQSKSAADAGRRLFNISREQKKSSNDTSRLARYLNKFNLQFQDICDKQEF